MTPTGKQISAARSLAGWDRKQLAAKAGLSDTTVRYVENENNSPKKETINRIVTTFREAGIEFIENDGVRRLPEAIEIYEGPDRFEEFADFMYEYLGKYGGEVIVQIKDDRRLSKLRRDIERHRKVMHDLVDSGRVSGRILAAEGDLRQGWAELRRMDVTSGMPEVSFYAFGDNLALISFSHKKPPYVVLFKSSPFAAAYKAAFDAAWERSRRLA